MFTLPAPGEGFVGRRIPESEYLLKRLTVFRPYAGLNVSIRSNRSTDTRIVRLIHMSRENAIQLINQV